MNFADLTRVMLSTMDFFELRRTAARYNVPFQGVRRNQLIRDLELKIVSKNVTTDDGITVEGPIVTGDTIERKSKSKKKDSKMTINTHRSGDSRSRQL